MLSGVDPMARKISNFWVLLHLTSFKNTCCWWMPPPFFLPCPRSSSPKRRIALYGDHSQSLSIWQALCSHLVEVVDSNTVWLALVYLLQCLSAMILGPHILERLVKGFNVFWNAWVQIRAALWYSLVSMTLGTSWKQSYVALEAKSP